MSGTVAAPELVLVWSMFINFEVHFSLRMMLATMAHTKGSPRWQRPLPSFTDATTRIWVDYPEGRKKPRGSVEHRVKRRKRRL